MRKNQVLVGLVVALGMALSAIADAACVPSQPQFEQAVFALKTAIKTENPEGVLALIGDEGLVIGEASQPGAITMGKNGMSLKRQQVQLSFAMRVKAYCHFMSCDGRPAFLKGIVDGQTIRNEMAGGDGQFGGLVGIKPTSGQAKSIELMFQLNPSCKWELTMVLYNSYDIPSSQWDPKLY